MTNPDGNQRTTPGSDDTSDARSVGEGQIGLGTDPAGTASTVDRAGDTGATSSDNADTPMGSLGGGLSDGDDR